MLVTCVDCGNLSPETDGLYSLVGEEGWRPIQSGQAVHWRCPGCWTMFKDAVDVARAPSANVLAAAPSEPPEAFADALLEESGERVTVGGTCKDDTRPNSRSRLIASKLQALFDDLSNLPPSPRVRELHAHAVRCQSIISMWRVVPPDPRQQLAVLERLLRVQHRVTALASSRGGQASGGR